VDLRIGGNLGKRKEGGNESESPVFELGSKLQGRPIHFFRLGKWAKTMSKRIFTDLNNQKGGCKVPEREN